MPGTPESGPAGFRAAPGNPSSTGCPEIACALSGYAGVFLPSWTDRRNNGNEEIWTSVINDSACTPRTAPTGLVATAISSSRIDLSWNAVSGAVAYDVYRSTTSGGPYSLVTSVGTTSYSNTGLSPSTTYYYVVKAFVTCESGFSSQAQATTQSGGGIDVFTGVATSFANTTVDLDAACNAATGGSTGCAGLSVRVGFTSITDCSTTDDGWFLDDVTVTACVP